MKPSDLIVKRDAWLRDNGLSVVVHDCHGFRRLACGVDVHLSTGSWQVTGSGQLRMNDWPGFVDWIVLNT